METHSTTNREGRGGSVSLPNTLFAHSLPDLPVEDWQRLDQHLNQVANLAKGFAEKFGSGTWGWTAGILHDLGKALPGHFNSVTSSNRSIERSLN